jgi:hypothetical protein
MVYSTLCTSQYGMLLSEVQRFNASSLSKLVHDLMQILCRMLSDIKKTK